MREVFLAYSSKHRLSLMEVEIHYSVGHQGRRHQNRKGRDRGRIQVKRSTITSCIVWDMVARSMPRVAQRILDARGFLRSPYAMEPLSLTHSAKGCLSMTKVSADIPSVGFASPNLVQEGWRGGGLEKKNYGKLPRGTQQNHVVFS